MSIQITSLSSTSIAYFCLEVALKNEIPTYAGGLGILAGDMLLTASDLGLNYCGVSLLYKDGYFRQDLNWRDCVQTESPEIWSPSEYLTLLEPIFEMLIFGEKVKVRIWQHIIKSKSEVKVLFLDTNCDGNSDRAKSITSNLYCQDNELRLAQEILLGIGGLKALELLNQQLPNKIHLNESAAAFLIPCLQLKIGIEQAKSSLVFTTHTPVIHGHRKYDWKVLERALEPDILAQIKANYNDIEQLFNQTRYCLDNSGYSNTVSKIHKHETELMFPGYKVDSITNGVHSRWLSSSRLELYNTYLGNWHQDPINFHKVATIPDILWNQTHQNDKVKLLALIKNRIGFELDQNVFTIGFARRVDPYKRHDLLVAEFQKLEVLADQLGGLQIIYSGKAYPTTGGYNSGLNKLMSAIRSIPSNSTLKIVYIPNYNIELGLALVNGVDLWLNNPEVGKEASGTSGMKASIAGIPSLSTLDGWWAEGSIEGVTGWNITGSANGDEQKSLFEQLNQIINIYYNDKAKWTQISKSCTMLNANYFGSKRLLEEYLLKGYLK